MASFEIADAAFAESLKHIGLRNALQSFKLDITNDRQFAHFKNNPQTAAWSFFCVNAGADFVEKAERQNCLKVASHLRLAIGVAGARLDIIEDIVFAQTTVALNVDFFDNTLLWLGLLRPHRRREEESGADNQTECGQ